MLKQEFETKLREVEKIVKPKFTPPPVQKSALEERNERDKRMPVEVIPINPNPKPDSNLPWIVAFLSMAAALASFIFFIRKNAALQMTNLQLSNMRNQLNAGAGYKEKFEKGALEWQAEYNILKNRLSELESKLDFYKNLNERLKARLEDAPDPTQSLVPPLHSTSNYETFFMSTPNEDGSFYDNKRQPMFVSGSSLYKFEVIGQGRAEFEFFSNEQNIKDAKYQPETLLEPVCEIENKSLKEIKSIESVSPGTAILEGDRWVVASGNKACIRYR